MAADRQPFCIATQERIANHRCCGVIRFSYGNNIACSITLVGFPADDLAGSAADQGGFIFQGIPHGNTAIHGASDCRCIGGGFLDGYLIAYGITAEA